MATCVFGLHRRGRIACPPFSKRGQKMIRFRWFLGPVVGVASKVCPKGAKGMPQWTQMSVKGAQKRAQRVAKGAQTPFIWNRFSDNFQHFSRSGAGWVHKGAQASQGLLKWTLKPPKLSRKHIPIFEEGPPTVNKGVSGETFNRWGQTAQPKRKELQWTMHPTGASQMQNNIEVRRCRVSVLNMLIIVYIYVYMYICTLLPIM